MAELNPAGRTGVSARTLASTAAVAAALLSGGAAAAGNAGLVARGAEPSWTAVISDTTIEITRLGDKGVETYPLPAPRTDGSGGRRYVVPDGPVLTLAPTICRDAATGMPHPLTVTLTEDGTSHDGCGGDPADLLTGGAWTVTEVAGRPVPSDRAPTITFGADGRAAGSSGCNRFTGTANLTGEGLRFGAVATTRMACDGAGSETERQFLDALSRTDRFDIGPDGGLILIGADSPLLSARR